jgi:indolepyruvate ferredoxin oxidoreductase alpha subunit
VIGARLRITRQFTVDPEKCSGCRRCLHLGCPALELQQGELPTKHRARINRVLCAGCGMCTQLCKFHAINPVEAE